MSVQESSDIHQESVLLAASVEKNKQRAAVYEDDLNSARDKIKQAQSEMKNIDSEVQNFQQKMSKSMHSLMTAFDDGFEAMEKAKKEQITEVKVNKIKQNEKRVDKLNKIHSSMANLSALTSKFHLSLDDENKEQNVQQKPVVKQVKKEVPKTVKKTTKVTANAQLKVAPQKSKSVVKALVKPVQAQPKPVQAPAKPQAAKQNQKSAPVTIKKQITAQKSAPAKPSAADLKAKMKAKMKAVLSKKSQKQQKKSPVKLAQKSKSQPMKLAQVESNAEENLKTLLQTQKMLKHVREVGQTNKVNTLAQTLGIELSDDMKKEASKLGSSEVIAHTMAERVIAQVQKGKSKEELKKELKDSKQALQVAQKAFYDKDPEAIALIQLNDDDDENDQSTIYLEESQEETKKPHNTDNIQVLEEQTLPMNDPDDSIQVMIDNDQK